VYEKEGAVINKVDFYDYLFGVAVGDEGLVLVTNDGGIHWTDYTDSDMGDLKSVDLITKSLFFANSDTEAFRSENGGKDWTNIFSNSSIHINRICKSFAGGADMTFICCDNGLLMASNSKGDKWFRKDVSTLIDADDDIHYFMGGKYDGFEDSIFQFVTKDIGFGQSSDNMKTLLNSNDFLGGDEIKVLVETYDFSPIWFGADRVFIAKNNKVAFTSSGSASIMSQASAKVVNGCVYLRRIIGISNDNWYGWAVGDNGLMMQTDGGISFDLKEVASLTDNDLNWIDWGGDYHEVPSQSFKYATICAVGDGVILQKTINWTPTGLPRISQGISTEVYPNPFESHFNIQTEGWDVNERVQVRLYDINGTLIKELYSGTLPDGELQLQVNENLTKGVYLAEISSATKREVKRLIKR